MTITQQVIDNTAGAGESAFSAFGKVNTNNTALFNAINNALSTYLPPGTGAVATTVAQKLSQAVSVFDWMSAAQQNNVALNIGSIDVTAAYQAAIVANSKGNLYMPPGGYLISGAGLSNAVGCSIYGVRYRSTFILGTQNMNAITYGDGTSGTRSAASSCRLDGVAFNPLNGVSTFTSGSCVTRNNVFDVHVNNCDFYGKDATTVRLWNAITDISTTDCDSNSCNTSQILNNVVNVSGAAGALASDCFYNFHRYNNIGGDALFVGVFIGGLTFTNPTGYSVTGWHFHMNSSPGNNGQNVFVTSPDFECDAGSLGGGYVQQGNGVSFTGDGWIGLGAGASATTKLLWLGVNSSNCKSNEINYFGGQILIDGPDNYVTGGNVSGDGVTSTTAFLVTSTATFGCIGGDIKINQYITSAVAFSGSPPALNFKVNAQFNSIGANATEITGISSANNNGPDCRGCTTSASTSVAAVAALPLNFGNELIQVVGATAVTSMTIKSKGTIQAIQAGAGGITINNTAGIITLSGSNISLSAFKIAGFICDGNTTWIQVF